MHRSIVKPSVGRSFTALTVEAGLRMMGLVVSLAWSLSVMTLKLLQGRHSGLLTERHCLLLWKVLYLTILQHSVTDDKKKKIL